jgi:hypothetical protein
MHLAGGGSVVGVTLVEEDHRRQREDIRDMVSEVRRELGVLEVEVDGELREEAREQPPMEDEESLLSFALRVLTAEPDPAAIEEEAPPLDPLRAFIASLVAQEKEPDPEERQDLKPPADPPVTEPPEQAKAVEDKPLPPEEAAKPETPLKAQIFKDKRIAIDQSKKSAEDNPDASRLAENAFKTDEETQARIRSADQKADSPSAGTNVRGPAEQEGNAPDERPGQSEDRPGDPTRAPGEAAPANRDTAHVKPPAPSDAKALRSGTQQNASTSPGANGRAGERPSVNVPGLPGGAGPASPETASSDGGSWNINPSRPGGSGSTNNAGKPSWSSPGVLPFGLDSFGFGAPGAPGGPPNVTWEGLEKAVGTEQLRKEREAVGQAIRAQHRGRFDTTKWERFLPDIENYDPTVKVGNQTALNAAASPFAKYLHDIHNRIHPIFADEFLNSLEGLAPGHPLRSHELVTHVEIILARDDGKVVRRGVVKNSGSTVFDAAALDSVDRAGPFGKAPDAIASKDGHVYLHWEFHRNLVDACSTRNAHPFIVANPKPVVSNVPIKKKKKGVKKPSDEAAQPSGPLVPLRKK